MLSKLSSFIAGLGVSRANAERSFHAGLPRADSPEEANREWRAYVPHWTRMLNRLDNQSDWVRACVHLPPGQKLAWLDNEDFWMAYWGAAATFANSATLRLSAGEQAMLAGYAVEAGHIGNMSFFAGLRDEESKSLALRRLNHSDCGLLHQRTMDWLESPGNQDVLVLHNQKIVWTQLPWRLALGSSSPMYSPQGVGHTLEMACTQLVDGFERHALDSKQQVHAIGHVIVNGRRDWRAPESDGTTMAQRMQTLLQGHLHDGVDVSTIALCSGHGPNTNATFKELKRIAKELRNPLRTGGGLEPGYTAQTEQVGTILSLYTLNNCWDLYQAVYAAGLVRVVQQESIELPAMEMA